MLDANVGDIVVLGQLLRVEGLTTGRRSRNKDLNGVETSKLVELHIELGHVTDDTFLTVPWEFERLKKFFLLFFLKILFLLRCKLTVFESIRGLNLKI